MNSSKRALGQYSTPPRTVDYMISLVWPYIKSHPQLQILDPAVGDGVFVDRLKEHGVPAQQIWAYDIDERAATALSGRHHQTKHQDFLNTENRTDNQTDGQTDSQTDNQTHERTDGLADSHANEGPFDLIIGNPPYKSKRESQYIRTHRERLEQQFSDVGIHNLYSMFTVHAIRNLKAGGLLCFIIQDSFLTNVYYRRFRRFILNHCKIHTITLAPHRLFHYTDADVRTAILLLEKYTPTGSHADEARANHPVRLTDRLRDESEFFTTPLGKQQLVPQRWYTQMDNNNFFVNVPTRIIHLITESRLRLADVVRGGTGISTGDDARFLKNVNKARGDFQFDETEEWIPFYKNGGAKDAWFYQTPYRIQRDWRTNKSQSRDFLARNTDCYFNEGITCSSMGIAFSAAYLPAGCLFGVNANFFTDSREELFYLLAFLNSELAQYMVRAVFNRTNMVTAGYLKQLPYVEPEPSLKHRIASLSEFIVTSLQTNSDFDYKSIQTTINQQIYNVYDVIPEDILQIKRFCTNLYESI